MKYFEITQETDSKIIGKYPQLKELKIDFHKAGGEKWAEIDKWKDESDLPDLDQFLLQPKSKLTDNLSSNFITTNYGLIISKKLYDLLQKFQINGQFKSATIHVGKVKHEYYLLWYEFEATSKTNWKCSQFIEFYDLNNENQKFGEIINVVDFDDYNSKFRNLITKKEGGSLWSFFPKVLTFDDQPYDLISAIVIGLIISEPLKNALEENNITGLKYKEIKSEIKWNK